MRDRRYRLLVVLLSAVGAAIIVGVVLRGNDASARGNVSAPSRQTNGVAHTVQVQGHGEVTATPDQATITLGIETRGSDAQVTLSTNASKMNAVVAAVQAQGVPASHIRTTDLSLWYDSQNDRYVASHTVTVRLDDTNKVGPVLDAAVGAGANQSWGVSFGLKDSSAAKAQALQKAVKDARGHADSIASALGSSISEAYSAGETSYNYSPVRFTAAPSAASSQAGSSTPVQAGDLTVTADVQVTYSLGA